MGFAASVEFELRITNPRPRLDSFNSVVGIGEQSVWWGYDKENEMSMTTQDLQQALDALSEIAWSNNSQWQSARARVAITAIRAHIANTKVQEPVAQSKCIAAIEAENAELRQICRNTYEVWAGSEGIPVPETSPEAYLLQLVEKMRDEVKRGLKEAQS